MSEAGSGRRTFLTGGLIGAAAGIIGAASAGVLRGPQRRGGEGSKSQAARVEWRLASSFPSSLDTLFGAAETLAEVVAEITDGAFRIQVYQAGELVTGLQVMDAVQKGSAEVGQTAGYYYTGKHPALAFDTTVPFGLGPRQQQAWLTEGGGLELMRRVYADFGIINFPGGNTGTQMGGWFKHPVDSLKDLEGLRMRIPGLGGKVMDRLGVSVQVLAGGDIYPALERGAIDATEWVGPYDDEKLGFFRVANNYYFPGWWEPGPTMAFLVNLEAWNKLPSQFQEAFRAASRVAGARMQEQYDARNPAALRRLLEHGVQLREFSPEIMTAAREASESLLDEEAERDASYREILEHWRRFRTDSQRWFGTAELSYARFASR